MENKSNHKKLLGKLNIVDVLILVVIFGIIFVGYTKFLKPKEIIVVDTKKIDYTVEIPYANPNLEGIMKVGDKLYDSSKGTYLGVVKDVSFEDQIGIVSNTDEGIYQETSIPGYKTIYLTIEGNGYDNAQDIFVEKVNIKIGKRINVKGKGYAGAGYVFGINLPETN